MAATRMAGRWRRRGGRGRERERVVLLKTKTELTFTISPVFPPPAGGRAGPADATSRPTIMLPHSTSLPSTGSPQPPPTAAAARREFERLASLGRGQRGRPAAPPLRPRPWAGVADPVLPTELEPPLLPDDAPGAGLDGFRDDADTPPDPPPLAPFLPLLVRAAMARWGGESPAATLAARLLQAKWAALRCGAEEAGALDAQLNAALKANAGLAADLDALADAMTEGEGDHPTYPGSEFGSADAVASFRAEEAASARAAAAAAAQGSPYAGLVKVSVLSYRASSSSGGGGGGRRSLFACCVAPPPTLDNNGAPSTFATPAAARFGGSGRRVKPYVHVWLKAGPGESRGDRDARPPARTAAARPLARTATARRGTAATWKDAASPTVAVATPDAVLEVAVRDGSKRRRLAAALAGDPVVGVGVLPLATIVDRAGPAAGPATWTVPIHAPSRGDRGGGSVVNGGGPALLDGSPGGRGGGGGGRRRGGGGGRCTARARWPLHRQRRRLHRRHRLHWTHAGGRGQAGGALRGGRAGGDARARAAGCGAGVCARWWQ